MPIEASDFGAFFFELHGRRPFPWQNRLAERVCGGDWPDVIDLPTASGKTSSIDIALFALACRESSPRRIFFVVDRRIVVNEAYLRMTEIAGKLKRADGGVLLRVADRLRELAGGKDAEPVEVVEMRGGIYRDESWVKTPLQPTVVASTVDQVGSRLLFRGYGLSNNAWPIHAGLIGNDSLILLDEAHCSRAFAQTLQAVRHYRGANWAEDAVGKGFSAVEMTATPSSPGKSVFVIGDDDKTPECLGPRIHASKPTRLAVSKNRPRDLQKLAENLCDEALKIAAEVPRARRIAIMVNRVATARYAYRKLSVAGHDVDLLIGRMRPYDRDNLVRTRLDALKSGMRRSTEGPIRFVVSTQCLEVGADLDFDVLVSECASIDALLQRFGRLNRLGDFETARGCIVVGAGQIEAKDDPVYGDALADTYKWLNVVAAGTEEIDMGIEAPRGASSTVAQRLKEMAEEDREKLRLRYPDAPVLLPAHLDAWVQTNPQPACEPLVELFLHGPERGEADVQVVWRADLDLYEPEDWADVISLSPPVTAEALAVPISAFRRWFWGDAPDPADSDLEGGPVSPDSRQEKVARGPAILWRGEESKVLTAANEIRPGDTVVLAESMGGVEELGHLPAGAAIDCGDISRFRSQRRLSLRLHPDLKWLSGHVRVRMGELLNEEKLDIPAIRDALSSYRQELPGWCGELIDVAAALPARELQLDLYPDEKGCILSARHVIQPRDDEGTDETSRSEAVVLERHLTNVEAAIGDLASLLGEKTEECKWAARFHDYGKADVRFQALLRNGDMLAAQFAPRPLAKSDSFPLSPEEGKKRRRRIGLPDGFRHELLSLLFAEDAMEGESATWDLGLHLIAAHHGRCRPFAPVVFDEAPTDIEFGGAALTGSVAKRRAAHRLDSAVADRFWNLTRKHGWWGLAYYEALFRLADWAASAAEAAEGTPK